MMPQRLETTPLSIDGVQRLIARLPAEQRAQLSWAPLAFRDALVGFLDGPRDDEALDKLAEEMLGLFERITPSILAVMAEPQTLAVEMERVWRDELSMLRDQITDPSAADAAEWAVRSWIAFSTFSIEVIQQAQPEVSAPEGAERAEFVRSEPFRLQVLLMALMEATKTKRPIEVVSDLAFRAYDNAAEMMQVFARGGVRFDPFAGETVKERAARLRRYAEHVRESLTDDELRELEAARLENF